MHPHKISNLSCIQFQINLPLTTLHRTVVQRSLRDLPLPKALTSKFIRTSIEGIKRNKTIRLLDLLFFDGSRKIMSTYFLKPC